MDLSLEYRIFLKMLADHICIRETVLNEDDINNINWSDFLTKAHTQQVDAIIFTQGQKYIKNAVSNEEFNKLSQKHFSYYFLAANREKLLKKIDKALTEANIDYILFKGTEIAQFYPEPHLRSMGDSDILVHEKDKESVHNLFLELGLQNNTKGANEWTYSSGAIEIELHNKLLYDYVTNYPQFKNYCDTAWRHAHKSKASTKHTLDWGFHIVFLMLHIRKHMLYSGVGFRQYMDLAVLAQAEKIDWNSVATELKSLGLLDFGFTCMAFCERWFGVKSPFDNSNLDDTFYIQATKQIMANGVFGFDDPENKDSHTLNELHARKGAGKKFRVALRQLFPEYKYMCESNQYAFVRGKRWLLVPSWVYRLGYIAIKGKAKEGAKKAVKPLTMENDIKSREAMLDGWGLD